MRRCVPLESAAKMVCEQSSVPPLIFQLPSEQGRKVLEDAQNMSVYKYPVNISNILTQGDGGKYPCILLSQKIRKGKI